MSHSKYVFIAGFAMFSMFFGSGNLVFPLYLGTLAGEHFGAAMLGLFITAVMVPFLGLLAIILFHGDRQAFFSGLGRIPGFLLTATMLALIGPFGVVPRCITVAYGSVGIAFTAFPFKIFCALFCIAIGALIWQKNRVVEIIGLYLTPWKLGGILILLVAGLWFGVTPESHSEPPSAFFYRGLSMGYQTMDLIAAFFFSAAIISYFRLQVGDDTRSLMRLSLSASLIGATLLVIIYTAFVLVGAKHGALLAGARPEEMLTLIAKASLGHASTYIVSLTLTVACLATAVILTELFVEFVTEDISQKRLTHHQSLILVLCLTFGVSLLGFVRITAFLSNILSFVYPALVLYTIGVIVDRLGQRSRLAPSLFWGGLIIPVVIQWMGL